MSLISANDEERISAAITAAERTTSGEIVAVVADQSSRYQHIPFMWAALLALIIPWPFINFTWMPVQIIFLIQLLVFLGLLALAWHPRVRMSLVPKSILNANTRRRASEQFLAQNLHTTEGRTGVLLFVSLAEKRVEIIADSGIDALVPKGTWQKIVDQLTAEIGAGRAVDGFERAIKQIGDQLAAHFPPGNADPNELPDHLIVLRS
ncbi:TPM domain-containing protein [Hyphomicrobium sp.]|uniref:TPM domain-containing protein n=1 Tax=Hyphomicrobium sp. TaxID=82 RepID=UPI001D39F55B|nr:TPM domain-containing protein [Hyphomicrobium sp.]MBY0560245.1 TPM domain-containing protein [Hyphomicrobium sp.]